MNRRMSFVAVAALLLGGCASHTVTEDGIVLPPSTGQKIASEIAGAVAIGVAEAALDAVLQTGCISEERQDRNCAPHEQVRREREAEQRRAALRSAEDRERSEVLTAAFDEFMADDGLVDTGLEDAGEPKSILFQE